MNRKRSALFATLILLWLLGTNLFAQPARLLLKPAPVPVYWRGLIGEYAPEDNIVIILEKDGQLGVLFKRERFEPLSEVSPNIFRFTIQSETHAVVFTRDNHGRATRVEVDAVVLKRRQIEPESGNQLHIN